MISLPLVTFTVTPLLRPNFERRLHVTIIPQGTITEPRIVDTFGSYIFWNDLYIFADSTCQFKIYLAVDHDPIPISSLTPREKYIVDKTIDKELRIYFRTHKP